MSDESRTELDMDIAELRDNIRSVEKAAALKREAAEKLLAEQKANGLDPVNGITEDDKEAFDRLDTAYKAADEDFETGAELRRRLDSLVNTAANTAIERARGDLEHPSVKRAAVLVSDRFMESTAYRNLKASGALSGGTSRMPTVNTPWTEVMSRKQAMEQVFKATLLGLDVRDPLVQPEREGGLVGMPVRALRVRDLVTVAETDSDTIEYVEETTRTDAAVETPMGDDTLMSQAAAYDYTKRTTSVRWVPHHVVITKAQLADAGQLRALLDGRLIYGVGKRIDGQMINGNGTGENLAGILGNGSIGTQALSTDTRADAFHKAMTVVRVALEDEPNGWLVHPSDFEEFALEKGADGHYLSGQGPQLAGPRTIWGLPAVQSTVLAAGTSLVGDFRQGATLYVREGIRVAASDSHSDFFLRGLVALLAEARVGFAVQQPKAFCKVTGV